MFAYIANQLAVRPSLRAQLSTASAGAVNGTAVDIGDLEGPILVVVDSPVASTGDTVSYTVQHSYTTTSGDFVNIDAGSLINPTTGDPATFTQVTDAVSVNETLALKRELLRRYVRIVATTAGTSISVVISGTVVGLKKYS